MNLTKWIRKENIVVPLTATTKTEVILELIQALHRSGTISDSQAVYRSVMERESLSTTGLSAGFAVPHSKTDAVQNLALAIGISPDGVDFNSIDGELSHVFFLMVAPNNQPGQHIAALAEIAKLSQIPAFAKLLKKAKSADEVLSVLE